MRLRSFRFTCESAHIPLVEKMLREEGYEFEPEPFSCLCAKLLSEPRPLGASLAAFFGFIYIQDRSSMLPPLALNPGQGQAVLDMCASPGSKSGFLAQLAGCGGFVLANEPNGARLATLRANLHQCNFLNAITSRYSGEKLPLKPGSWPFILLDPPCSGWGTEEKNPRVRKLWRGDKNLKLIRLQRELLRKAAELLAPGGALLYSTCTTNIAEDEEQTIFAENELGLERAPLAPFRGFAFERRPGGDGCLLVDGKASQAQGFYLSLLRKSETVDAEDAEARPEPFSNQEKLTFVPRRELAGPFFDPSRLPPGRIGIFNGKARLLPSLAFEKLPRGFVWQGALIGNVKDYGGGVNFSPSPRLRSALPREDCETFRLVLEDIADIRAILDGKSRQTGLAGNETALWWRNLPLGRARLKSGRAIAAFR